MEAVNVTHAEQVRVPFVPSAARTARFRLSSFLSGQQLAQPVVDDALLVVSELVTNAVRHATPVDGGELAVFWELECGDLMIAVEDGGSTQLPEVKPADVSAETGRGLSIVSVLTRRWWVEHRAHRVRVSALLDAS